MIERGGRHAGVVRDFLALAEGYRREGELLRERGFRPERVVGQDALVWRSPSGQLFTTATAIEAATATEVIPEARKEERK